MEAQFEAMEGRLEELTVATAQPEIIADVPRWQGMLKEMAQLEPAVKAWREYKQMLAQIEQAKEMRVMKTNNEIVYDLVINKEWKK